MESYSKKTIKQHSGIMLGSVETHDCDPYMDCPECNGTGTCQECKGKGEVKCHNCHGSGKCQDCHGKGRWRCDKCGGTGNCRRCQGTGDVQCSTCHGRGRVNRGGNIGWEDCRKCGGSGLTPCPDCRSGMQTTMKVISYATLGSGKTYGHGSGKCSKCGGSGEIECKTCNGSGDCQTCHGSGNLTCNHCKGSGNCPNCDCGKVTCERCEGTGHYQTFTRRTATLYSKGWKWGGSTEFKELIKASFGQSIHNGPVKTWSDANTIEKDIVEETNNKCESILGAEKNLYKEFLTKYEEQTELFTPSDQSDKPVAKELNAQQVPITRIKYAINNEKYEVTIIGNNNIVAAKSIPNHINGFELSKWEKIKLAMTEKSRLKAFARLGAYVFQCDGKNAKESIVLESMIKALKMTPKTESKFRKELETLNTQMPYEKVRKMIKPLLSSKKTITFAWECMAVDKKITQQELVLFDKIVSEYKLEHAEIERLKGLASKFSKLQKDQIAIEYASLSEDFADIRKKTWNIIIISILVVALMIGIAVCSFLNQKTSASSNDSLEETEYFGDDNEFELLDETEQLDSLTSIEDSDFISDDADDDDNDDF